VVRRFLLVVALGLTLVPTASAAKILGLKGGPSRFHDLTGQVTDSQNKFVAWGTGITWPGHWPTILDEYGPMPMLSLMTKAGADPEKITPRGIALGRGDHYLISINNAIADFGKPVYVRPMGEMNGYWNSYCAYNANGTRRNAAHSQRSFRLAFRRIYLIMHGGSRATINAKLNSWGLPGIGRDLPVNPYPTVRVVWNPQGFGAPNVRGNMPRAYWPGSRYVDVVGDDLYDQNYRAAWAAADALYDAHPGKPFSFPEWGLWGVDDPAFVHHMGRFVRTHPRVEMLAFYNGDRGSIFDIGSKPRSRAAYRTYITSLG
jgi:hypothetical protein